MTSIAERVAAGAAFLDQHDPGWWRPDVERAIDLNALELADPALCVLGQRCPLEVLNNYVTGPAGPVPDDRYWAYAEALMLQAHEEDDVLAWASERGFSDHRLHWFPDLTAEWTRVIEQRRAGS